MEKQQFIYGPYEELMKTGTQRIETSTLNINNWRSHFDGLLNILKDSIETEFTQNMKIDIVFEDNRSCTLFIMDYIFNIVLWYLLIRTNIKIQPKHIVFEESFTQNTIKNFIDKFFLKNNRKNFSNKELNNIIDDTLCEFSKFDQFSMFLANTINLEDDIIMMQKDKEYYDIIHADLSTVPIEEVKNEGMKLTRQSMDIMKNKSKQLLGYDHCLADSWRASQGVNPRQYKEYAINIGSKPDGHGSVFPVIINRSYLTGGVNDLTSYTIDSTAGRIAQILSKLNVGDSGGFARIIGLNNLDTFLYPDSTYDCGSRHFIKQTITDESYLDSFKNRYYRFSPDGIEYCLDPDTDKHLIGKTLYFRSPSTCISKAQGKGICYKCYGDLAYTNSDISIGQIAVEELTSKLTQKLLSAKHLLETVIKKLSWSHPIFDELFEVDTNIIRLLDLEDLKNYQLLIHKDELYLEDEEEKLTDDDNEFIHSYNEYVTRFFIKSPNGTVEPIFTSESDKLYLTVPFNNVIRHKASPNNNFITIKLSDLVNIDLFCIMIRNNELSKTLDKLISLINKESVTTSLPLSELIQEINKTLFDGGLDVDSIHIETIMSNQIRDSDNILEDPDWMSLNPQYQIITLNTALTYHPSVTIALSYQNQARTLYNPLTFRRNNPSFMDLFFMNQPQRFIESSEIIDTVSETDIEQNFVCPIELLDNLESDGDDDYPLKKCKDTKDEDDDEE